MTAEWPITCSIVVESKPSAIVEVCGKILSDLQSNCFSQDDIFAVHLALEEAFINAIRHGNKMDPTKKVKVDYLVGSEKVEILVTDQGDGFDPEAVPDPRLTENLYKPGGRGLFLINSYMDEVTFSERGNRVRLVRFKEKPPLTNRQDQAQA
jgi:serine/threonine-protein kinase RsbW